MLLLLVVMIAPAAVIAAAATAVTVVTAATAAAVAASRYHPTRLVDWARRGNCELQEQVEAEVDKDKEELLDSFLPLL